jgi:AraC-like DNA-binding protein
MFRLAPQLRKYAIEGSSGGEALSAMLTKQFPDHLIELGPGSKELRAQIGLCPLNGIQLFYGRYESPFRVEVSNAGYFMQGFPVRGSAETVNNGVAMTSSPSKGALVEPGAVAFSPAPKFEHLVTLIDSEALLKALTALAGTAAVRQVKLDRSNFVARPEARLSRGLVKLLVEELDAEDSSPSPVVIAELEQAIVVAFLCGNSHNYSSLLDGLPHGAAPWQLRRVEEYIEANWDQPISIEALAVVANASARSIFHSFREHRRYSPMSFVKQVRLRHAREMLSARSSEITVTTAAFACGFGNLGHFASDYNRAFGEAPSATLHRAKCGPRP